MINYGAETGSNTEGIHRCDSRAVLDCSTKAKGFHELNKRVVEVEDTSHKINNTHKCFCIGPQNGEPVCPCRMKSVIKENGRYKQIIDLGPVNEISTSCKKVLDI
jgi:hypothetical protein